MAFKYRGILAKKRKHIQPPGPLADEATRAAWAERYTAQMMKVWRALYEAHGVEWMNESELLRRMGEAHVPGFMTQAQSGPKVVWDAVTKAELHIAVDEYVADRKRQGKPASISQACAVLARDERWAAMLRKENGKPAEALRGHYNTADPRWIRMVADSRKYDALLTQGSTTLGDSADLARSPARGISRRKKST